MFDLDPSLGIHDLIMVFRTLVLYGVSFVVVRIMGKRSLGQLSPFDFLIIIIIGSAIATPMEDESIPLVHGLIPIITIVFVNYILYLVIQKNRIIEDILQGKPVILIENGKLNLENLKSERITLADLLILLRGQGIREINEVQEAVMEPNGQLSIVQKEESLLNKIIPEGRKDEKKIQKVKDLKKEYDFDLNLVLDGLALGLDDKQIAEIAGVDRTPISLLRDLLGVDEKGLGFNLARKERYLEKE